MNTAGKVTVAAVLGAGVLTLGVRWFVRSRFEGLSIEELVVEVGNVDLDDGAAEYKILATGIYDPAQQTWARPPAEFRIHYKRAKGAAVVTQPFPTFELAQAEIERKGGKPSSSSGGAGG